MVDQSGGTRLGRELDRSGVELGTEESLLRRMLEALPIATSWVEPDGRIGFWNRRASTLFGYTLDEVSDRHNWYRLAYPDPAYREQVMARWFRAVEVAARDRSEIHFEAVRVRTRAGTEVEVELQATFVGDKLLVVFHDLTDRQRAERALRQSEAPPRRFLRFRTHVRSATWTRGNTCS